MSEPTSSNPGALTIETVQIDRLAGIDRPFAIDSFVPGINLIIGPNASGKSRTATTLRSLIWPALAEPTALIGGTYAAGDATWSVSLNGRTASHRRDGQTVASPSGEQMAAGDRDRYLLSLQDLLQASDKPLAEQIQRESAGGYDLPRARIDANVPKVLPKKVGDKEVRAVNETRNALRTLIDGDTQLRKRESSLTSLEGQMERIKAAQDRLGDIDRALEHTTHVSMVSDFGTRLKEFAEPVSRMTGNEFEAITALQAQIEEHRREASQLQYEIDAANQEIAECRFTEEIPEPTVVADIRERTARMSRLLEECRNARTLKASSAAELTRLVERLESGLTADQLAMIDTSAMRELAKYMQDAMAVVGKSNAERELQEWVGSIERPKDIENLGKGIELLSDRLRLNGLAQASAPHGWVRWALLASAVVIVVLSLLLATEGPAEYAVLALLAGPLIWIAFRKQAPDDSVRSTEVERAYRETSLPEPDDWTPESIVSVLAALRRRLAVSELDRAKAEKWDTLADRRAALATELRGNVTRRDRLRMELGIEVLDADWDILRALAKDLDEWRSASERLARADDLVGERERHVADLLAEINLRLASAGCPVVVDEIEAEKAIDALQQRIDRAREAFTRRTQSVLAIEKRVNPAIERCESRIVSICEEFGVHDGRIDAISGLCAHVDAYRELAEQQRNAMSNLAVARGRLAAAPDLLELDRTELEFLKERERATADLHDATLRDQTEIERDIRAARQQHLVEDATATDIAARDALEAARIRGLENLTAWRIAEFIGDRTRDLNRPDVYRKAGELFAAFTSGSYTLEFQDSPEPLFQARDTSSKAVLPLEHLSSGTRLQLLFAVRVAFIETRERGYQLPLILDEVLANTDDQRMSAVMDATIEIARRGRQVFYLTAQHDEIAKWQTRLSEADGVPHATFDLAAIRDRAAYLQPATPIVDAALFTRTRPSATLSYTEARAWLSVGPIDPWADGLGHASIWYFVTDVPALVLAWEFGLMTWGQFELRGVQMLANGVERIDEVIARARIRHRVIEVAISRWREGRSAPFTRNDLIASKAFTAATHDSVCGVAELQGWDGELTIRQLRLERMQGVTAGRIEKFEEWLEEEGKVTAMTRLSPEEIRGYVTVAVHDHLDAAEVDAILTRIALRD